MHFYAEAPITSFFPRISTSKKRKIHTEPTPFGSVGSKRQRDHTSLTPRQGFKSKAKDDEKERLDNGAITILHSLSEDLSTPRSAKSTRRQTIERHMPLLPSLNVKEVAPQTPKLNALPPRKKLKTSLQTPPPTNGGAERQGLMEFTPTLSPFISRKSSDLHTEKVLLPTPSTLGRLASHHNRYSGSDRTRAFRSSQQPSPTPPQHSNTSVKASVPVTIPSSQSQLMDNAYFEEEHGLTPAGTALSCKRPQLSQYEESPPNRILLNRTDKDSAVHASQMVVCSSQSQFLSRVDEHDSPRRSIASNSELDTIPSSQSQEYELRIFSDPEEYHQPIRSRKLSLPQRTLSHELFSVSILQTSWSVGSLDLEQPIKGTTYAVKHVDDSATESETEPETEEKASCYHDHTPMPSQPYKFSQDDLTPLNEGSESSQRKDWCYSQQSSLHLSLAGQTSSIASLPSAVKEFQSMFGSDEESYPPDFPMSLR